MMTDRNKLFVAAEITTQNHIFNYLKALVYSHNYLS